MEIGHSIHVVGEVVDVVGVTAIVIGVLFAGTNAAIRALRREREIYIRFRLTLGRAILLGLELLVAADIIKTVAITPTIDSLAVLAILILIRTFLSWSLELELTGRWPWQAAAPPAKGSELTEG